MSLKVRDNGNGFDVRRVVVPGDGIHFGLVGLSERAKRIGGELAIRSDLGRGTEIELTFRNRSRPGSSMEISQT
jgi:two-component system NarL family sensor kinase